MKKIVWDPSFSVGVERLDEQHQQIIRMINKLSSIDGLNVRSEEISELLTKLTAYAKEHFKCEETLLEEYGYPQLAHQKEEHKVYRLSVVAFCDATMSQLESVPSDLETFLHDWWINHIKKSDMEYRSFLMEKGVS